MIIRREDAYRLRPRTLGISPTAVRVGLTRGEVHTGGPGPTAAQLLPSRVLSALRPLGRDDGKFPRDEARGIDRARRGLLAALPDDAGVLARGFTLFDGLYATLSAKGGEA